MLQLVTSPALPPFDEFYQANYDRALGYIAGKLGNHHDAEDLTEEVFVYCYRNYDKFDPSKSSLTTWLYMIINCRIKNHYRDARSYVDLESVVGVIPEEGPGLDEAMVLEDTRSALMRALNKLPELKRRIVIMSYFENKTSNEIAAILGLTPGNVRVQLSRALKTLEGLCADIL